MAGIARAGDQLVANTAATRLSRSSLSSTALVSSSTNNGTPSARSTISATVSWARLALPAVLDQRGAVMPAEPVQRQCGYVWLPAPAVLKLGAKGDDDEDGQPRCAIDGQVEQLARGRVDPMHVLEDHKNQSTLRQDRELMQQCLEQHLALALRAEVEVDGGVRQRQQLGEQCHFIVTACTWS